MPSQRLFDRVDSVQLQNVTKKYEERFAVEHLNLKIYGGELLILIGPSGSGKTTTLRMINRLIEPDEGSININNQDVMKLDPVKLRRNIGYVIQNVGLFPHMTVRNNIGLIPRLEGWTEKEILERVEHLLNFVALPPEMFMGRYPRQLSGGQQQRVGLARALAMDPPLLLMDEPFGALDPILRKQLQDEFITIKQKLGRTIIFVTHDIEEAFKLGDRIAIMADGKLIQTGTPEELVTQPENVLVANIVDANRKFRHIDTLKVRDLMSPLDGRYIFDASMKVDKALIKMTENNVELTIVFEKSRPIGQVEMIDLFLSGEDNKTLKDIAKPSLIFSPEDSIASTLAELKNKRKSIALVMEGVHPLGILLSNDALLRLI